MNSWEKQIKLFPEKVNNQINNEHNIKGYLSNRNDKNSLQNAEDHLQHANKDKNQIKQPNINSIQVNSLNATYSKNNQQISPVKNFKYKTLKWNNNPAMKRVQRLYTDVPLATTQNKNTNSGTKYNRSLFPRNYQTSHNNESSGKKYSYSRQMTSFLDKNNPFKDEKKVYNKQHPPYGTKQQLYQQNLLLKNTINELKDLLQKQRMSTEVQKKKNKKYTSKLSRQFRKDFYYSQQLQDVNLQTEQRQDDSDQQQQRVMRLYNNDQLKQQNQQDIQNKQDYFQANLNSFNKSLNNNNNAHNKYHRYLQKQISRISIQKGFAHTQQYMIAGIKQKYEQLQADHAKVLKQLQILKSSDARKKLQEINIYCMVLEQSNRKLATGIQLSNQKLAACVDMQDIDKQLYKQAIVCQMMQKNNISKQKNIKLKQQNKKLKQNNKQCEKIIRYLQQLVISKQNLQVKSVNSLKKLTDILNKLQNQLAEQKKLSKLLKDTYMKQLQQQATKYKQKINNDRRIFQQALMQRNNQIKKIQKQKNYMLTIIQNWKLSDNGSQPSQNNNNSERKRKKSQTQYIKQENDRNFDSLIQRKIQEKQYEQKIKSVANLSHRSQAIQQKQQKNTTIEKQEKRSTTLHLERKRKNAKCKNSQNSKKMRRVAIQQISDLPEYLRYRMIGLGIQVQQILKYLDYRPIEGQKQMKSIESDDAYQQMQKWKKIYINQADLSATLMQQPFKLSQQDAINLGRYIVQDQCFYENNDSTNAFVYVDFQNQIQRNIAKSILKSFLQTFSTNFLQSKNDMNEHRLCEEKWKQILKNQGAKINTPLLSIASSGVISKQRWNQLLKSLSVQVNQNLSQWCIGKMLIQSQGLNKLKYRAIIPQDI